MDTTLEKPVIIEKLEKPEVITKPILLSDCKNTELFISNDYNVHIDKRVIDGQYLVITTGYTINKINKKVKFDNVYRINKKIFNFKKYYRNGSKKWSAEAGIEFILIIPKDKIYILPEKGYSYIPIEINGVKIFLNVCGGGSANWTDYLSPVSDSSVNIPIKNLKKICEVAVTNVNPDLLPEEINKIEEIETKAWQQVRAENYDVKQAIMKLIDEARNPPKIKLIRNYNNLDLIAVLWEGRNKRVKEGDTTYYKKEGSLKSLICKTNDALRNTYLVKVSQVDWYETAVANNIDLT